MRGVWNFCKGEGKEKEWIYEGNADEQGMGGWGEGEERALALGTGVPRIAESAYWLVGQCMCVEVVQYYCFYVCFFAIEWI